MRARGPAAMARQRKYTCHRERGRNTVSLMKVAQADSVGSTAVMPTRKAVRRRDWPVARTRA